jgi:ribonucleoside-triphosphate reductase
LGLNEAVVNFMDVGLDDEQGRCFGLKVLDFMRDRLVQFQEETGHHYNLEATPGEGTSYRLAMLDHKKYPDIKVDIQAKDSGKITPFYSNSSQLPVHHGLDVLSMLDHQDEFQCKYTGGTVAHIFLGEAHGDPQAVAQFIKTICHSYKLPYVSLTPTFSVCPEHGYKSGRHHQCPECGAPSEVYSRVVGYLRPVEQWNEGKQQEFDMRSMFKV